MQPSRRIVMLAIAAAFGAVSACNGDDPPASPDAAVGADAAIPPSCIEATMHEDLDWIQDNILTPSCANFTACHRGSANLAGGLNLEDGMSEVNLVEVESLVVPRLGQGSMKLVEPGDPDNSYLIVIMRGEPEELIDSSVGIMPYGNMPLCDQKIEAIARWIESL
jgi:hypothetical protein